jgi:hypothetical protein
MLIAVVLGAVLLLVSLAAIRFARMDEARETAAFARRKRAAVVFEGRLTGRAARESVPDALLQEFEGDRVRITVQRLGGAEPPPPE